jgi:hypothetical protein
MYCGNERLGAPHYDYGKFFHVDSAAAEGRLLVEEMNAVYQKPADPRPWSERHPAALGAALVAAIVVPGGSRRALAAIGDNLGVAPRLAGCSLNNQFSSQC